MKAGDIDEATTKDPWANADYKDAVKADSEIAGCFGCHAMR